MKAFIIEDEVMAQKSLIRALSQNFQDIEVIGTTTSVKGYPAKSAPTTNSLSLTSFIFISP